jgi:hypothetical protein
MTYGVIVYGNWNQLTCDFFVLSIVLWNKSQSAVLPEQTKVDIFIEIFTEIKNNHQEMHSSQKKIDSSVVSIIG